METFLNSAIMCYRKLLLFTSACRITSGMIFPNEQYLNPITSGGKQMRYKTSGVCSSAIEFELDDQKKYTM